MQKRSLFSRIFGSDNNTSPPQTATEFRLLDNEKAVFTTYSGDYKNDPDVLACVDAIARNGAKLHPKHIRNYFSKEEEKYKLDNLKDNIYKLLAKQPNELQNAYKFYYQLISELKLNHNAIIYVSKDADLKVVGLYPIKFDECKFYEYRDDLWIKFKFGRGKERFVNYNNCIHLTEGDSKDGIFGGNIAPIKKILSMKHILDEGIINAIKTTQSIKGIIKSTKAMLKPEDVKKMRDQFVKDFIDNADGSGVGGLDATTTFDPVKLEPTVATAEQTKQIDDKVLKYFGINEKILTSSYNENEWNAFYESIIEPIALQMSLEFTNKLFTATEKSFGNEILFESNRLQYASNNTKIEVIRYCGNILTINEQREILNLAPIDGGDVFMIDQNHEMNDSVTDDNTNDNNTNEGNDTNEGN